MRRFLLLLALALLGCDRYPPTAVYVTDAPPAAKPDDTYGGYDVSLTANTAVGVVFLVNDKSTASGTRPGTEAIAQDDTVARVLPAAGEKGVKYGASRYEGRVFVVYGVEPGDTSLAIFEDGQSMGSIDVHVLPPE